MVVAICQFIEYDWNILNYSVLVGKRQIRTEWKIKIWRAYHARNIGHKTQNTKQQQKQKGWTRYMQTIYSSCFCQTIISFFFLVIIKWQKCILNTSSLYIYLYIVKDKWKTKRFHTVRTIPNFKYKNLRKRQNQYP